MLFSYPIQFKHLLSIIFIWPLCLLLQSCGSEREDNISRPDVSNINLEINIHRLEKPLFEANSRGEIKAFLEENESFAQKILRINEYPSDSIAVEQFWQISQNPHLDTLYRESQQIFSDAAIEKLEQEFETAFKYIKFYYPDFQPPQIYTIISGFGTEDLFLSEEMLVIGLDYFLGPKATFRPQDMPQCILQRYAPEYLVPGVMLLYSSSFNHTDMKDKTMMAEMVYYGKSLYFVDFVVPSAPDSVVMGFTDEEMQGLKYNEASIWDHFLKNELIFETNHVKKKKYLEERPKTVEVGDKAPGRIGQWVGLQIVQQFMQDKDDLNLRQLMELQDARYIFNEAKYRP